MKAAAPTRIVGRLAPAFVLLLAILATGTAGYRVISEGRSSPLDCLYMTFITVSTIGYGEVVDLSASGAGRLFTILIAVSGIGVMTYIVVNVTAFIVEGDLHETFRRRKMEKLVEQMKDHHIVCGLSGAGAYIARELLATGRPLVAVEQSPAAAEHHRAAFGKLVLIEGDPADSDTLLRAGIERARGIFAATDDDKENLVISLTAKQLNASVRVIARCEDVKNSAKMKKAGADAVISPPSIGGLRMASEMIRPSVVSFLDLMLRGDGPNLRIEEVRVPEGFEGRSVASLSLETHTHLLLLAVRSAGEWQYKPPGSRKLKAGDTLVFMATPEERRRVEEFFSRAGA